MTTTMKKTTMTTRLTAIAFLTTCALLPACGDLGSARVDNIAYQPDGSLVVFMATGIHVLAPSLDRETMTIPFDGLPVNTEQDAMRSSLSAGGYVAAVSFSPPVGSTEKSTITLFDMTTGTRGQTFRLDDAGPIQDGRLTTRRVFDLVLSPQADLVYVRTDIDSGQPNEFAIRTTVFDVASGAMLWTSDAGFNWPVFSADGTRLFVVVGGERIEALDARTGARLYATDSLSGGLFRGLSLTEDGKVAGIVAALCTDVTDCPSLFGSWSSAELTLLGEQRGRSKTSTTDVITSRGFGAAFACSPWNGLCALGLKDEGTTPPADLVSVTLSDGTPLRELAVPGVATEMAFAPSGNLLTIVSIHEDNGQSVQVFNVDDGAVVGSLKFSLNVP